jgi:DNA-binding transcriptional LysR family regulator
MELYQLRHFVAVVETSSFTKGAERCAVSQPAISASIAKLESEVGTQLLVRQKKQVVATAAGKRLFDTAVSVLHACSAVKADLKQKDRSRALRIGVVETLPAALVSSLVKSFRRERDIAIEVWDGNEQDLNARLGDGRLDAALTIFRSDEKISAELQSRALFSERSMLLVPTGHRLAGRPAVRLNDLAGEAFISRPRCENYSKTSKLFAALGVRPRVVYRTDQDARALELIGAGIGVAIMPASFESPDTEAIPVEDLPLHRTIGLRWARENETRDLADFVAFAASHHWPKLAQASAAADRRRKAAVDRG